MIKVFFQNKSRSTAMLFKKKKYWYITCRSGHHHMNKPPTQHNTTPNHLGEEFKIGVAMQIFLPLDLH
jgi:hypothetical protein